MTYPHVFQNPPGPCNSQKCAFLDPGPKISHAMIRLLQLEVGTAWTVENETVKKAENI